MRWKWRGEERSALSREFAAERFGHEVAGGRGGQMLQLEVRLVEVVVARRPRRRQQVHRAVPRVLNERATSGE